MGVVILILLYDHGLAKIWMAFYYASVDDGAASLYVRLSFNMGNHPSQTLSSSLTSDKTMTVLMMGISFVIWDRSSRGALTAAVEKNDTANFAQCTCSRQTPPIPPTPVQHKSGKKSTKMNK